ncbi:hypothetical protein ACOSQ2_025528 [Xanthoceras sorbifolium]
MEDTTTSSFPVNGVKARVRSRNGRDFKAGNENRDSGKDSEESRGKENVDPVINSMNKNVDLGKGVVGGQETINSVGGLHDAINREASNLIGSSKGEVDDSCSKIEGTVLGVKCVNETSLQRQELKNVGLLDVDLGGKTGGCAIVQINDVVVAASVDSSSSISVGMGLEKNRG